MNNFYKRISFYLAKNKMISKGDQELYEYAIKIFIHGFINTCIVIIIGVFSGMIKETFYLFCTVFVLRKITGGIHAEKYINCLIYSICFFIVSLLIIGYLEYFNNLKLLIPLLCISVILICVFSPVENENKKLSYNEKRIFKFLSSVLSIFLLIFVIVNINKNLIEVYSISLGMINTTILILLAHIKKLVVNKKYRINKNFKQYAYKYSDIKRKK